VEKGKLKVYYREGSSKKRRTEGIHSEKMKGLQGELREIVEVSSWMGIIVFGSFCGPASRSRDEGK